MHMKNNKVKSLNIEIKQEIKNSLNNNSKLFSFLKPEDGLYIKSILLMHVNKIILITILNIIQATITGVQSLSVLVFIRLMLESNFGSVSNFDVLGYTIHVPIELIYDTPYGGLLLILLFLVGISLISLSLLVYLNHLNVTLKNLITYKMRSDLVDKLFLLDSNFYDNTKVGEIEFLQSGSIRKFGMIVDATQTFLNAFLNTLVVALILIQLSLFATLFISFFGYIFLKFAHKLSRKVVSHGFNVDSKALSVSESFFDIINGIRLIKQAAKEKQVIKEFKEKVWDHLESSRKMLEYQVIVKGVTEVGGILLVVVLAILLHNFTDVDFVFDLSFTVGFVFLFMRLIYQIRMMLNARIKQAQTLPQLSFFRRFLDSKSDNKEVNGIAGSECLSVIDKGVKLNNINFKYDSKLILKDISLSFKSGSLTAIVGPSGSGKSTLLEIIAGYQFPTDGNVLINNLELKKYKKEQYRRKTGYVNQSTIVFHDSILNNIAFLNQNASFEEILKCASIFGVDEIVRDLEYGWETHIGEKGAKISGGQRQRIAISRVFLQKPLLLILDEATSSLDLESESKIYDAINTNKESRVTILTAHRLSAITHADNIIVLNNGEVAEQGSHKELMNMGGIYYKMFQIQQLSSSTRGS